MLSQGLTALQILTDAVDAEPQHKPSATPAITSGTAQDTETIASPRSVALLSLRQASTRSNT